MNNNWSPISSITKYLLLLIDMKIIVRYSMIQPEATKKSNKLEHVLKYFPQPVSLILNQISTAMIMFMINSMIIKKAFSFHAFESAIVQITMMVHMTARAK